MITVDDILYELEIRIKKTQEFESGLLLQCKDEKQNIYKKLRLMDLLDSQETKRKTLENIYHWIQATK